MKKKLKNGWISPEERLPDIGKDVFIYYEITGKDEVHKYKEIASIDSITHYATTKIVEWIDKDYNHYTPLYWQDLPEDP